MYQKHVSYCTHLRSQSSSCGRRSKALDDLEPPLSRGVLWRHSGRWVSRSQTGQTWNFNRSMWHVETDLRSGETNSDGIRIKWIDTDGIRIKSIDKAFQSSRTRFVRTSVACSCDSPTFVPVFHLPADLAVLFAQFPQLFAPVASNVHLEPVANDGPSRWTYTDHSHQIRKKGLIL